MSASDEIGAIDARLAELAEEKRERQRTALLAEIGEKPSPEGLTNRIAEFAAEDLVRAWTMPGGALTRAAYEFLAGLLNASGITEAQPGLNADAEGDIYAVSASRGRVKIGVWDEAAITAAERGFLIIARAEAEQRSRDLSRGGLTRDQIIDAAIANREPDGTWPKQAAVAEALRLADARQIRNVQGRRGWPGIIADAKARLAASTTGG